MRQIIVFLLILALAEMGGCYTWGTCDRMYLYPGESNHKCFVRCLNERGCSRGYCVQMFPRNRCACSNCPKG
ncbi:hypothetical protein Y032_0133g1767 [Ancylostoma ceylanicum]|uniref:Uncharacterized protein n=1 Tax=Ancylostoma ceylanicum TaxID=53326 RepID=A0A016T6H5_9BILA|nr:hypothetical protein Y032_0133g1767 [Ancylostoma ceylanicum]